VDVEGLKASFTLTVPLDYSGIYSRLTEVKTAEVQVIIREDPKPEPVPEAETAAQNQPSSGGTE
jgi:hypothetical protein